MKISRENMMQKGAYDIWLQKHMQVHSEINATHKKFADPGSLLETWVNIFLFMI